MILNKTRVIPVLLISDFGLYNTVNFKEPRYIGDPLNTIRIFNEKEVDELIILDFLASKNNTIPNFSYLQDIAGEAFMPLAYGGNLRSIHDVRQVFTLGFEKIVLNSSLFENPSLVDSVVKEYGSQSVIGSIDVKKKFFSSYKVYSKNATIKAKIELADLITNLEQRGVGELLVNSIDNDGCMNGYDLNLVKYVTDRVSIPVIACGGLSSIKDMSDAIYLANASAVSGSSFFVYIGPHRAVLITYPDRDILSKALP